MLATELPVRASNRDAGEESVDFGLRLTRFPGHLHSVGENPTHEVPWEKVVGPSRTKSSAKRCDA